MAESCVFAHLFGSCRHRFPSGMDAPAAAAAAVAVAVVAAVAVVWLFLSQLAGVGVTNSMSYCCLLLCARVVIGPVSRFEEHLRTKVLIIS